MTIEIEPSDAGSGGDAPGSLIDALLVYAEPLASGAHAVVIGDSESSLVERLLDVGARSVHVLDPDRERAERAIASAPRGVTVRAFVPSIDVRDGVFDLAVVTDLSLLEDPRGTIALLRRAVAPRGAVVAMGRARVDVGPAVEAFSSALGPATLDYEELYELFAAEFEDVGLVGVVPFQGVVFAELGSADEAPAVSVDTRLVAPDPPSIFVAVATGTDERGRRRHELDSYAIVQVPEDEDRLPREAVGALEAAFGAATLKADLLSTQADELRQQLVLADMRLVEAAAQMDRSAAERDAALTRAMELEAVLTASQQAMATLERRLLEAERGCLERDDRIAGLSAELHARRAAEAEAPLTANVVGVVEELTIRADKAEAELAVANGELAHIADVHGAETAAFEAQLSERARVIATLEKELVRREQLVRELVASLEEAREGTAGGPVFEAAAPLSTPVRRPTAPDPAHAEEVVRLRSKLDELAAEIARREGELTARGWRIAELENERAAPAAKERPADADAALRSAYDELDALRQALAQEHAARVAAESGEELARARSELAGKEALLEQMRGRAGTS